MQNTTQTAPTLADVRARRDDILALAERYGVRNVRIFGSVARDEARSDSDIDLLVDFPPRFSLLQWSSLVQDLRVLLGAPVQVTSASHLREAMRAEILQDAQPL